ncbi:MAG: hypothetical protein ABEI13_04165 [Candidatus Paceibacteria bacterium]
MGNGESAGLIRGGLAITIAFISIGKICVWMYSRSKWLKATLIPYILWLIPITALTWGWCVLMQYKHNKIDICQIQNSNGLLF